MIEVSDPDFAEQMKSKTCVVDFYASWCHPCRAIAPILHEIEEKGIEVFKVDIDEEQILASQYQIRSVPTVMFIRNGEIVQTIVGAVAKAKFLEAAEKLI
jgi:thioredoxin 1